MDNRVSPIGGEGMRRTDQNSSSSRRVVSPRSKSRFTRPESSGEEVGPSTSRRSRQESRGGGVEFESFLGSGRDGGENPQIQPLDRENPVYEDPNGVSGSRRIQGSKRGESGLYSLSQRGGFIEFASSLNRSAFSVQRQNSRGEVDMLTSSQREMSEDSSRLVYINDPLETNSKHEFSGNSIRTSKYSIITFIPRNLYEQFHRIAYIYFLVITIMNNLPQLAVFGRAASALPLVFVLVVTAMKDAYEDFRRHRSDKIENNRVAHILEKDHYMPRRWRDICVGEIIRITANETIPCDMVLLSTSDPTGVAYIQTINLDGESNLKTRYAKQETMALLSDMEGIRGMIRCELPNRNIYGFQATMDLDDRPISLGPTNIILRGCELKNTAWAVGVVVYAGPETKAMLNSSGAPSKRSRLETHMNRETIMLSIFLIALCSMVTTLSGIWMVRNASQLDIIPYFRKADYSGPTPVDSNWYGIPMQTFFIFLMAIIVFQTMIPISLYISMELVRLGQAYFMSRDHRLYDESSNSRFQCRALNINEDLGMIKYVFSDKTGTLTENKMEFQCASIRGKDYNAVALGIEVDRPSVEVSGQVLKPKMEVKVNPDLLQLLRNHEDGEDDTEERRRAEKFFLALATCNTIVPLITETSERGQSLLDYQGESPDEQALVYSAAAHGYALIERTSGYLNVDVQGLKQKFNVLGMHEFDSDRKRMSVIVRCPDGTVKLFVKGADSSMFEVINEPDDSDVLRATKAHLQGYSNVGLRTLVIAVRDLTPEEFNEWQAEYAKASTALIGRASLLKSLATATERDLFLLGATAIEDKLQEGVPEAIESLRLAGIKVWVLTGDKQETAISIGFSCRLLTTEMRQIIINSRSRDSCRRLLEQATKDISQGPAALIIDGTSLVYVLETDLEDTLFELATNCTVVLCCRVAPMQKAGIVALIKERTEDMSLAIGDGANDVSMIQMADIGIGISGQEGRQAVMASDFSMGQFRFLVPLLLVHGHWNYQRIAYMVLYNFYRNAVFVLVLFWYTLYTAYTLTTAITEWSSVAYSVIYTSVPTVVVGILDKDLSHKTLLRYPSLYGIGQREESYNIMWFWVTMFDTLWQSVAIFYIPYCVYQVSAMDMSSLGDLWTLCIVIVVNLHLAMDVLRWSWITHVAIWGSIIASFISVIIIDSFKDLSGFGAIFTAATYPSFWLNLLIVPIAALLPRFIVKIFNQQFLPSDIQISREQEYLKRMRPASATVESRSNGYANGNR